MLTGQTVFQPVKSFADTTGKKEKLLERSTEMHYPIHVGPNFIL